jgi:hypothetical protein
MVRSVLGQRVVADSADAGQRAPAERADRPGHGGDHAPGVLHPAVDVEPDHALDVLPARDQAAPVGDPGVPGDRTDLRIRERRDQPAHGGRLEDRVAVITTTSPRAAAIPAFSAAGLPPLGWRITRTPGNRSAATASAVPSVDPSSTTITSTGRSLATSERTVATWSPAR